MLVVLLAVLALVGVVLAVLVVRDGPVPSERAEPDQWVEQLRWELERR